MGVVLVFVRRRRSPVVALWQAQLRYLMEFSAIWQDFWFGGGRR